MRKVLRGRATSKGQRMRIDKILATHVGTSDMALHFKIFNADSSCVSDDGDTYNNVTVRSEESSCTCPSRHSATLGGIDGQLCKHSVHILTGVFGITPSDPRFLGHRVGLDALQEVHRNLQPYYDDTTGTYRPSKAYDDLSCRDDDDKCDDKREVHVYVRVRGM